MVAVNGFHKRRYSTRSGGCTCPLKWGVNLDFRTRREAIGADADIACFQAVILQQTFATRNPLFLLALETVAKLTLYATPATAKATDGFSRPVIRPGLAHPRRALDIYNQSDYS
jgi:hypothetical protein